MSQITHVLRRMSPSSLLPVSPRGLSWISAVLVMIISSIRSLLFFPGSEVSSESEELSSESEELSVEITVLAEGLIIVGISKQRRLRG